MRHMEYTITKSCQSKALSYKIEAYAYLRWHRSQYRHSEELSNQQHRSDGDTVDLSQYESRQVVDDPLTSQR